MSRGLKRFFAICAIAVGAGLILSIIGFAAGGIKAIDRMSDRYDWIHGSPGNIQYITLEEGATFDSVEIKGDVDVAFYKGDNATTRIGYGENEDVPKLYVENGVLKVESQVRDGGVIDLSFRDRTPTLEVYCGEDGALNDIDMVLDYGDVRMNDISANNIRIGADLGDVHLYNTSFDSAEIRVDAGDIEGSNIKSGGLNIQNNLGSCELDGEFTGITEINVDSGDMEIYTSLLPEQYTFSADVSAGDLSIGDGEIGSFNQHYSSGAGPNVLTIKVDLGDADIHFGDSYGGDNHDYHDDDD